MKSLKINDKVLVIAGNHKGEEAKIVKVDRTKGVAMLEGIGVREKTLKKTQYNPRGGKKIIHLGINLSNLKLIETTQSVKSAVKKIDRKSEKSEKKVEKEAKKADKKAKKGAK